MTAIGNPVLAGCFPDPSVCRVGEWFYLVNSTFEYLPGLPIHRSRDLLHWEPVGHAVTDQIDLSGLPSSRGLYAPTLRHHDGRFWLVCTAVDAGGHFLLTADDPAGPWSDPVWLDGEGIDPSLFFDDDGRIWFHATRPAADPEWPGQTEIWLRELVDGALVGPEHVLWTGALRGAVWAEGPHLYRIDGRYYLLAAEGGTEFHHAVTVARADAVTGPYLGDPANPVLTHRHLGRSVDVAAVGHADLVQAADGSWWALLLGVRPYGGFHHNLGRETFLVPVTWEDAWPVFAPGQGRVPTTPHVPTTPTTPTPAPTPTPTPAPTPTVEVGTSAPRSTLRHQDPVPNCRPRPRDGGGAPGGGGMGGVVGSADLGWCAPRHLPTDLAIPDGDGWLLPVRDTTLADTAPSSFLGVRQRHIDCEVVVSVAADLAPGAHGHPSPADPATDPALDPVLDPDTWVGLAVRQSESDHLTLLTNGVETRATLTRSGRATPLGTGPAGTTLALRTHGQDYTLLVDGTEVATADGRSLDSVSAGGFLGLWIGPYATGRPDRDPVRVVCHYRPIGRDSAPAG